MKVWFEYDFMEEIDDRWRSRDGKYRYLFLRVKLDVESKLMVNKGVGVGRDKLGVFELTDTHCYI